MVRLPVSRVLRGSIDEAAIARIWKNIRDNRRPLKATWLSMLGWGAAGALLAMVALGILQLVAPWSPVETAPTTTATLARADGVHIGVADVSRGGAPLVWLLSDGSRLTFQPDTRWEPLSISPIEVVSSLRHGATRFEVKPGGPRRWIIQAGPVSVEVVGTVFTVERDERKVVVSVERGAVLVRGERVPDSVQRLTAGQRIEVLLTEEQSTPLLRERAGAEAAPSKQEWMGKAARGEYRDAYDELGAAGVSAETLRAREPQQLLALADIARLSGHPADAVPPLDRLLQNHPERPEAAFAAVTLGRLFLDQLGRPRDAARAFERALALGVPRGLQRDVRVRLVEAYTLTGDSVKAEGAARASEAEFPGEPAPRGGGP